MAHHLFKIDGIIYARPGTEGQDFFTFNNEHKFIKYLLKPKETMTMKILFPSMGETIDSSMDNRFARADWFVVVDTETMETYALRNGEKEGGQVDQYVADADAEEPNEVLFFQADICRDASVSVRTPEIL
ncbi:TPA: hypothetical protein DCG86_02830, partial [Candidatus Marinimicrobia bacterium]|nr:hypothetical protein [Candidatus Neomarinimicrobiota bacterium]